MNHTEIFRDITLDEFTQLARSYGVPGPIERLDARHPSLDNWSLSATYGLEEFPWHTDGAIAKRPPRYIALYAPHSYDTPTEIHCLHCSAERRLFDRLVLRATSRGGHCRYLPAHTVLEGQELLRWDSRICEPICDNAESVKRAVHSLPPHEQIQWTPRTSAIIPNWISLHRRPPVNLEPNRYLLRINIF